MLISTTLVLGRAWGGYRWSHSCTGASSISEGHENGLINYLLTIDTIWSVSSILNLLKHNQLSSTKFKRMLGKKHNELPKRWFELRSQEEGPRTNPCMHISPIAIWLMYRDYNFYHKVRHGEVVHALVLLQFQKAMRMVSLLILWQSIPSDQFLLFVIY